MSPEEVLFKFALELKYNVDRSTRDKIQTLYKSVTGKRPSQRTDLLNWFWNNFQFDGIDTWHPRARNLLH